MAPRNDPEAGRPPLAPRLFSRFSQLSKRSFLSHSSSFEADDERSSTGSLENFDIMSPGRSRSNSGSGSSGFGALPPRYPGDDTRPTSPKELAGWYAYAFAAEVYVICG